MNLDEMSSETGPLDGKDLTVNGSVPGPHRRSWRVGVEFSWRDVTISSADVEAGGELQQQRLLKLVGQTVPVGIHASAVPRAKRKEAEQKDTQKHIVKHFSYTSARARRPAGRARIRPARACEFQGEIEEVDVFSGGKP
jgi:hypothetical protein